MNELICSDVSYRGQNREVNRIGRRCIVNIWYRHVLSVNGHRDICCFLKKCSDGYNKMKGTWSGKYAQCCRSGTRVLINKDKHHSNITTLIESRGE